MQNKGKAPLGNDYATDGSNFYLGKLDLCDTEDSRQFELVLLNEIK